MREVGPLRQLVEKTTNHDACNRQEEEFGAGDDDARSIWTMVPHELERVEEEDEDQIEKQERQLEEDEDKRESSAWQDQDPRAIDELFESPRRVQRAQWLESAVELSSLFQAQHAATQSLLLLKSNLSRA
jgi:hypothetical protein